MAERLGDPEALGRVAVNRDVLGRIAVDGWRVDLDAWVRASAEITQGIASSDA